MSDKERLKNIKLIASDLDGTLLSNRGEIGDETKQLIKRLKEKGILFTFASGRVHSALSGYSKELDIDIPLISLDGCLIKNHCADKVLFEAFLSEKYVRKALALADKFLLNIALCHSEAIYFTEHNSVIPQLMDKFGAKYEEVESYRDYVSNTLEVVIASDSKENVKRIRNKFTFPHARGLSASYFKSQTHRGVYYLEIRKKGCSKGRALLKLLKNLKLKTNQCAIIGDWYNDISLFEIGALNVTLANSIPELKMKADITTNRSNNEDGVAEFLEMVLKAKN